jgi:hypothetical protein
MAQNAQLLTELSKVQPDYRLIRRLLDSGKADINAFEPNGNRLVTAFWYIQGGLGKQEVPDHYHPSGKQRLMWVLEHPDYQDNDFEAHLERFKQYFYPLLDILEDYGFDIMRGSSFRLQPDGTVAQRVHAGWRFLDLAPFRIMAKYDVPRVIQFFERLYFSHDYAANDLRSTESSLSPGVPYLHILLLTGSLMPEMVLYMIMKGADWTRPQYAEPLPNMPEGAIKHFAAKVPPDAAAEMIIMLQRLLGVDYILGPQGASLRGFLAAAYGAVGSAAILEKAASILARRRRAHAIVRTPENYLLNAAAAAGAGGQVGGRRRATKRRRRKTRR